MALCAMILTSIAAQLLLVDAAAHHSIVPSSSLPSLPERSGMMKPKRPNANVDIDTKALIFNIRGGDTKKASKVHKPPRRSSTEGASTRESKRKRKIRNQSSASEQQTTTSIEIEEPNVVVQSILIPRQTSFLTPLRFLSFLLLNVSFNSCIQTAGQPLEDAIRRILSMPSPEVDPFSSKVTPLHVYVAKRISSSTSTVSTPSEMLPPGHLPSPIPLLGFFLSIIFYVGGTVLLPKWNVGVEVLLNYMQFYVDVDTNGKKRTNEAGNALQNWYDANNEDEIDPYYSSSKKPLSPAVLVYEKESTRQSDKSSKKVTICPLFDSPGYDDDKHLHHPRRFYFELDQKRYYYDPIHSSTQSPAVISGGPSLHETTSYLFAGGLQTDAQLSMAKERYAPYADVTIPVPTLKGAFAQRIASPLVSLQLLGRLLSLLEEESIGRALANLVRLGFQHFVDAKRSIASASTLAEEVKDIDKSGDGGESRFWALRPSDKSNKAHAEWIQIPGKELYPNDIFVIAPESYTGDSSTHVRHSVTVPVDALLLEGTCVTEEAALTGETVPQAKVPLDLALGENGDDLAPKLDMSGAHRSSCVFAGTHLLHSSNLDEGTVAESRVLSKLPPLPTAIFANDTIPAIYKSLRTGSYSSRGEIIQSLLKSRMHVGVTNRQSELDSMRLIGVLALFAVGACVYLLVDEGGKQTISVFKKIIQCTRIGVASVPADLPASLAGTAHMAALMLREEYDTVNSEAGALLESSSVDTVVFDKTGTLTADTEALTSIVYPPCESKLCSSHKLLSKVVLAGGHTLVAMGDDDKHDLVGDPVDLAGLRHTKFKYTAYEKCAISSDGKMKLWQIRSFPFDPIKKMSSAIVLVQNRNGEYQLLVVAKGSPNKIKGNIHFDDAGLTRSWYDKRVKRLGQSGIRSIGLATLDVSDTDAASILFPSGLPKVNDTTAAIDDCIHEARNQARASLVRSDLESYQSNLFNTERMSFVGFACFSAPMRLSTPSVVNALKASVEVKMLTGDEPYASLAVANKAGVTNGNSKSRMCLLMTNDSGLVWEVNKKPLQFTLETAKKVKQDVEERGSVLVVSGDAVSALLSGTKVSKTAKYVESELLPRSNLIASASPNDKCLFVKWLENSQGKNVLMCGDGVNDLAALREATVSVALLSGFGHQSQEMNSANDLRRMERLKKRRIGSNRITAVRANPYALDEAGVGNSAVASVARIRTSINTGVGQIQSDTSNNRGSPQQSTVFDVCITAIKDEIKRNRDLRKGGSIAAKILAEDERLQASLLSKAGIEESTFEEDDIQTGESCLASSFTLLRPCISGVESILRTGVSAAACSISLYRKVALNCMMSCYNLATLYKNGLRYGKWMWQVELGSIVFSDRAAFAAASTPRPRLVAGVRPSTTPFHASEVVSTILQAMIHIVTLTWAVNAGKELESMYPTTSPHKGFGIKWGDGSTNDGASTGSLLATMVGSSAQNSLHSDTDAPSQSFFKRSPFQPNYVSNNVFIFSVFQNAVTTLVNHSGRPFSVSFLESRQLCVSVSLAILLCTVCMAESFPMLNEFIQLAPFPNRSSKVAMLRVLLLNISMSYFAEYFSTFFLRHDIWKERNRTILTRTYFKNKTPRNAADEEEKLLAEERQQNIAIVSLICFLVFHFSIQALK